MPSQNSQTLEQKLLRLKGIQQTLESGSIPLTESMTLLEEALELKKNIEKELKSMENRLIDLTKSESENVDFEV
jgi:exodeoxyribonuclease VII small subunit